MWNLRKPESSLVRGLCVVCGVKKQRSKTRSGRKVYLSCCTVCYNKRWKQKKYKAKDKRPYVHIHQKKKDCEACHFVALHPCQLDIDHIDGNHNNNEPSNLQTLCSNCHRLKTYIQIHKPDWAPSQGLFLFQPQAGFLYSDNIYCAEGFRSCFAFRVASNSVSHFSTSGVIFTSGRIWLKIGENLPAPLLSSTLVDSLSPGL